MCQNYMTQKNELYFQFLSLPVNIAFARSTVAAFAVQIEEFTEAEYNEIRKAVSEAVSNCVQHGYPNSTGMINISVFIENDLLTIVIEDQGAGIENIELAKRTEFTTRPGENLGWGFNFMEACMDEIEIESVVGKGTKLTMKKRPQNKDARPT
ncbi:MAG: anti-sigma F factor [Firmicutes bacterium]|nr:anti-sigma F factor [Bacillota bacterium]MDD4693626.1 anti-sigma F factor [Bacillota bacterium]